jgi:hypothetical protein
VQFLGRVRLERISIELFQGIKSKKCSMTIVNTCMEVRLTHPVRPLHAYPGTSSARKFGVQFPWLSFLNGGQHRVSKKSLEAPISYPTSSHIGVNRGSKGVPPPKQDFRGELHWAPVVFVRKLDCEAAGHRWTHFAVISIVGLLAHSRSYLFCGD